MSVMLRFSVNNKRTPLGRLASETRGLSHRIRHACGWLVAILLQSTADLLTALARRAHESTGEDRCQIDSVAPGDDTTVTAPPESGTHVDNAPEIPGLQLGLEALDDMRQCASKVSSFLKSQRSTLAEKRLANRIAMNELGLRYCDVANTAPNSHSRQETERARKRLSREIDELTADITSMSQTCKRVRKVEQQLVKQIAELEAMIGPFISAAELLRQQIMPEHNAVTGYRDEAELKDAISRLSPRFEAAQRALAPQSTVTEAAPALTLEERGCTDEAPAIMQQGADADSDEACERAVEGDTGAPTRKARSPRPRKVIDITTIPPLDRIAIHGGGVNQCHRLPFQQTLYVNQYAVDAGVIGELVVSVWGATNNIDLKEKVGIFTETTGFLSEARHFGEAVLPKTWKGTTTKKPHVIVIIERAMIASAYRHQNLGMQLLRRVIDVISQKSHVLLIGAAITPYQFETATEKSLRGATTHLVWHSMYTAKHPIGTVAGITDGSQTRDDAVNTLVNYFTKNGFTMLASGSATRLCAIRGTKFLRTVE